MTSSSTVSRIASSTGAVLTLIRRRTSTIRTCGVEARWPVAIAGLHWGSGATRGPATRGKTDGSTLDLQIESSSSDRSGSFNAGQGPCVVHSEPSGITTRTATLASC